MSAFDFAARVEDEHAFIGYDEGHVPDVEANRGPGVFAYADQLRFVVRVGGRREGRVDVGLGLRDPANRLRTATREYGDTDKE